MDVVEQEVDRERKVLDYETAELTAEIMVGKMETEDVFVPPYQRPFMWKSDRQSKFIESLLLQLPVPYIFCFDKGDGRLEVLDGSQRLRTIRAFLKDELVLDDLEKLPSLNGYRFSQLSLPLQRKLKNRPLRTIILSQHADENVRFDIFHRLNSGGLNLSDAQIRRGAFSGPFYAFVEQCAQIPLFVQLCPLDERRDVKGEREELALRYFVYADRYKKFTHDVGAFLNQFVREKNGSTFDAPALQNEFADMLQFVYNHFPSGFKKSSTARGIPRVRFEAISVGTHLALRSGRPLNTDDFAWLNSVEFAKHTRSDGSNSGPRLIGRIEYVRDMLLGDTPAPVPER
jgi:hypothetical protein